MSFEFKVPFDGRQPKVPAEEREFVSTIFTSYVDDKILGNMGDAKTNHKGKTSLWLTTRKPGKAGVNIYIDVFPESRDSKKSIGLLKVDENNRGGERLSYRLGLDGVVRRVDSGPISPELSQAQTLAGEGPIGPDDHFSIAEIMAMTKRARERVIENGIPNHQLATDLGINNQPVGSAEIEGLVQLVETAHIRPYGSL